MPGHRGGHRQPQDDWECDASLDKGGAAAARLEEGPFDLGRANQALGPFQPREPIQEPVGPERATPPLNPLQHVKQGQRRKKMHRWSVLLIVQERVGPPVMRHPGAGGDANLPVYRD